MNTTRNLARYAVMGQSHTHWYRNALIGITQLCDDEGWNVGDFIDVLALTSPRIRVAQNWAATVIYMRTRTLPRYIMRSSRRAVLHWEQTGVIRGRKTSAFADAIKGNEDALVLDVWMARALNIDERRITRLDNMAAARRRCARVARMFNWTMAETQAAIWCGIMFEHNIWPTTFEWAASGVMSLNRNGTLPLF